MENIVLKEVLGTLSIIVCIIAAMANFVYEYYYCKNNKSTTKG
jgi:hypothetical protein